MPIFWGETNIKVIFCFWVLIKEILFGKRRILYIGENSYSNSSFLYSPLCFDIFWIFIKLKFPLISEKIKVN